MSSQIQTTDSTVNPYLSPAQRDLLFAALKSQAADSQTTSTQTTGAPHPFIKRSTSDPAHNSAMSGDMNDALFMSPQDAELDAFNVDYTPDLDYLDADNFDFENADLGGDMIGALPGSGAAAKEPSQNGTSASGGDGQEKRKNIDENDDTEGGDAKRQETQEGEKTAKKPGRKPLTNEPTTKRKAQNRAAQRAFRERKEKHLKDLETKVTELEKTSEADKHENGLLKAQVDRLQVELREYRKRLSLNSSLSRSPPATAQKSQQRSNSGPSYAGNFQFDFPKFGALPGSQIFPNQTLNTSSSDIMKRNSLSPSTSQSPVTNMSGYGQQSQGQTERQNSVGRSLSPHSIQGTSAGSPSQLNNLNASFATYSTNNNMHGFAGTLPQMKADNNPFGDLFSPSILKSANANGYFNDSQSTSKAPNGQPALDVDNGGETTAGLSRVFHFNGGSNASDSTSPSASSSSPWNTNGTGDSSCGTSPEPLHYSPAHKDTKTYGEKADFLKPQSRITTTTADSQLGLNAPYGFGNTDFSAGTMNGFDPVLFGDYRDSNEAIVGGGDFTGGFFDDALNSAPFDFGSPSNLFGILQSPRQTQATLGANSSAANAPSKNLMAEVQKTCDGGDDNYGLSTAQIKKDGSKLISCNNIWNQLQSNPDFQEGKFDLDGLCSELRAKARCSDSGVLVDQDHVDAALRKLGKKDQDGKAFVAPPLMFEQDSWDNIFKKLRDGSQ